MKQDPKNIVRVYLVAVTRTDYQTHKCADPAYIHAFTNKEDAQALVQETILSEKAYVESHSMTIDSIEIDKDESYMYGKDTDGHTFYFNVVIMGSVPIVFNYEDDWKSFKDPVNCLYTAPDKQVLPKTLHIVNQYMTIIGGCLPDLPDTAYINKEDAYHRIDDIFQNTKECWESEFSANGKLTYEIKEGPYSKIIIPNAPHYYFEVYYAGEVPLN